MPYGYLIAATVTTLGVFQGHSSIAGFFSIPTSVSRGPSAIVELLINFGGPIHISRMAEARGLKFCTQGDYIKFCQRDDESPLKGAWFGSHNPFLHAQLWT